MILPSNTLYLGHKLNKYETIFFLRIQYSRPVSDIGETEGALLLVSIFQEYWHEKFDVYTSCCEDRCRAVPWTDWSAAVQWLLQRTAVRLGWILQTILVWWPPCNCYIISRHSLLIYFCPTLLTLTVNAIIAIACSRTVQSFITSLVQFSVG